MQIKNAGYVLFIVITIWPDGQVNGVSIPYIKELRIRIRIRIHNTCTYYVYVYVYDLAGRAGGRSLNFLHNGNAPGIPIDSRSTAPRKLLVICAL